MMTMRRTPARLLLSFCSALALVACNGDKATTGSVPGGFPPATIQISVPSSLAVRQGATVSLEVNIIRTNYTAAVFVTVTGLPNGVTAPSVSSTSNNQLLIPLVADTNAVLGSKSVTVNAQGTDVPFVTGTVSLTVSAK